MTSAHADTSGSSLPLRGRVLIVDDQEAMRDLLKTMLECDYHVAEADSGAALHRALDHDQPDVVLLDLKLSDANGLGLVPAITQRWPGTEIIVLTGAPSDSELMTRVHEAANRGTVRLLSKHGGFDLLQNVLTGVGDAMHRRFQGTNGSLRPQV
jgi:CheY-like chemotaxis protein